MARKCSLRGTKVQFGNSVSHSKRKTRRMFLPNIQNATFISDYLGKIKLSVTPRTIRTIDFKGGIDQFLLQTKAKNMTVEALKLKRKIRSLIALK